MLWRLLSTFHVHVVVLTVHVLTAYQHQKHLRSLLQPTYSRGDSLKRLPFDRMEAALQDALEGKIVRATISTMYRTFKLTCLSCYSFFFLPCTIFLWRWQSPRNFSDFCIDDWWKTKSYMWWLNVVMVLDRFTKKCCLVQDFEGQKLAERISRDGLIASTVR